MSGSPDRLGASEARGPQRALARLFGRLLLRELDAATYAELAQPELRTALGEASIELPADSSGDPGQASPELLDELAAQYFETFVQPREGGPLVQSLWTDGWYEGDAAVTVSKLAQAARFDFDRGAARGAPRDHLGSILLLWAATDEAAREHPTIAEVASRLRAEHLSWACEPLARIAAGQGFYAGLAGATATLIAGDLARPRR